MRVTSTAFTAFSELHNSGLVWREIVSQNMFFRAVGISLCLCEILHTRKAGEILLAADSSVLSALACLVNVSIPHHRLKFVR